MDICSVCDVSIKYPFFACLKHTFLIIPTHVDVFKEKQQKTRRLNIFCWSMNFLYSFCNFNFSPSPDDFPVYEKTKYPSRHECYHLEIAVLLTKNCSIAHPEISIESGSWNQLCCPITFYEIRIKPLFWVGSSAYLSIGDKTSRTDY